MLVLFILTTSFAHAEIWDNIKSPVVEPRARTALLAGTALTTTLLIFEDQIVDPTQRETVEDKPLGKYAKYGDLAGQMLPNAAYVVGMVGYAAIAADSVAWRDASLMTQATAYSALTTILLKTVVREERPDSHNKDSFPSGHSTTAFAFASYVACRHAWPWGVGAYGLAGFVAYSRMNDDKHYIHDVVGGATIGTAYGIGVCAAETKRKAVAANGIAYLAPLDRGLALGWHFDF